MGPGSYCGSRPAYSAGDKRRRARTCGRGKNHTVCGVRRYSSWDEWVYQSQRQFLADGQPSLWELCSRSPSVPAWPASVNAATVVCTGSTPPGTQVPTGERLVPFRLQQIGPMSILRRCVRPRAVAAPALSRRKSASARLEQPRRGRPWPRPDWGIVSDHLSMVPASKVMSVVMPVTTIRVVFPAALHRGRAEVEPSVSA